MSAEFFTKSQLTPISSEEESESKYDPQLALAMARVELRDKLERYEKQCRNEPHLRTQLVEFELINLVASTALIEELALPTMKTLLAIFDEENAESGYYQKCLQPHLPVLLPVLTRLIMIHSNTSDVSEKALQVLCSATVNKDRYDQAIAATASLKTSPLESRPFLVRLAYLCRRRLENVVVSEEAAILVSNIVRFTENCSTADYLISNALSVIKENQAALQQHLSTEDVSSKAKEGAPCLLCPVTIFFCLFFGGCCLLC